MDLLSYMDRARAVARIPSDRQLAVALGINPNSLRQYRLGLAAPSPRVMLRLADLAGVPPELALLDRAAWQADDQDSRRVMSEIIAQWMERPADNPLKAPRSLGAAATLPESNGSRLRYIMEFLAAWIFQGYLAVTRQPAMLPS